MNEQQLKSHNRWIAPFPAWFWPVVAIVLTIAVCVIDANAQSPCPLTSPNCPMPSGGQKMHQSTPAPPKPIEPSGPGCGAWCLPAMAIFDDNWFHHYSDSAYAVLATGAALLSGMMYKFGRQSVIIAQSAPPPKPAPAPTPDPHCVPCTPGADIPLGQVRRG